MEGDWTRRGALAFGLSAAGAALASCTTKAAAQSTAPGAPPPTGPSRPGVVPLPFDPSKLDGLSEQLVTSHHDKNYAGAVKKLGMIRQRLATADPASSGSYWSEYGTLKSGEAAARNSALLHELYFANLIGPDRVVPPPFAAAMGERFGSTNAMIEQMKACGRATGGWVVLVFDRSAETIDIVPTSGHAGGAWHAEALLVLDVFEHSFAIDYGPNKGAYLDAFFRNVHWDEVARRFAQATS